MERVKVNKAALIAVLKKNRESHIKAYKYACEEYREAALCLLDQHITYITKCRAKVDAGSVIKPEYKCWKLDLPEDHTKDYDLALEMLNDSVENEVVLTKPEYRNLWKDDWDWKSVERGKRLFYASNSVGISS